MQLTDDQKARARAILRSNDEGFLHLLRQGGLDPARVLRGADLRGVVFTPDDDLSGLDLTGADLRGANLELARGVEAAVLTDVRSDARTRGLPLVAPPPEFDLEQVHSMILRGEAPPVAWVPFIREIAFIGERNLRDVTPLAGLTALQRLDLQGTRVSDVTPLAGLTALQRLDLWDTRVSDVTPLAGLTALQSLDLRGMGVSDVRPLAGLTKLRQLRVSRPRAIRGLDALRERGVKIEVD